MSTERHVLVVSSPAVAKALRGGKAKLSVETRVYPGRPRIVFLRVRTKKGGVQ
jgi:hypothetical protein